VPELLPGKDFASGAQFCSSHASHHGIPGFQQIDAAGIQQYAERHLPIMGCQHVSDQLVRKVVTIGLRKLCIVEDRKKIAVSKYLGFLATLKITFRQLLEEHTSVLRLAEYLDKTLPPEAAPPAAVQAVVSAPEVQPARLNGAIQPVLAMEAIPSMQSSVSQTAMQQLVEQQLRVMAQQLALLSGAPMSPPSIEQKRPEPAVSASPISTPAPAPAAAAPSEPRGQARD
jgi:hypothetical protein